MNLKLRLERLCDAKSWARLHFADGTSLTGRFLRIGHDYVEIESYGDSDKPATRDHAKHLVPLHLVKFITVESGSFAEAERNRLRFMALTEDGQELFPEAER